MMLEDIFVCSSDSIDLADKDDSIAKRYEIRKAFFFDKDFAIAGYTDIP
jgi:hypothetical protein